MIAVADIETQQGNVMAVTEDFAGWIASVDYSRIPRDGIEAVKRSMLDWVGCAVASVEHKAAKLIADYVLDEGGKPNAVILANRGRSTSANAALANGVLGHIEDFDDSGAHPA